MTLNDYQTLAMQFRMVTATEHYAILNLSGEVGELHSLLAKAVRDGVADREKLAEQVEKELGDILWTLTAICESFEIPLEQVATTNLLKLHDRKKRNKIKGSGDDR